MINEHDWRVAHNARLNNIARIFAAHHAAWERALESRYFVPGTRLSDEPKNADGVSATDTPEWEAWQRRRRAAEESFRVSMEIEMEPHIAERDAAIVRAKRTLESGLRTCEGRPWLQGTPAVGSAGL